MVDVAVLRAAGLSDKQVVDVIAAEQSAQEADSAEKLAATRERNRINQQNHRARKRVTDDSGDRNKNLNKINGHVTAVTADSGDNYDSCSFFLTSSSLPLSEDSSSSQTQGVSEERSSGRGRRLPPDWQPNEKHLAAGKALGLNEAQIIEHAQDMRLWADANSNRPVARKADWDKTFHGWMRRNKGGNGNGHRGPGAFSEDRSISRAAGRLAEKARCGEFTFGPRPLPPGTLSEQDTDLDGVLPPRRCD